MTKLTLEHYLKCFDIAVEQANVSKQWYLDYRCGSGMNPMLEEFADIIDKHIAQIEQLKQLAKSIEPRSLLNQL